MQVGCPSKKLQWVLGIVYGKAAVFIRVGNAGATVRRVLGLMVVIRKDRTMGVSGRRRLTRGTLRVRRTGQLGIDGIAQEIPKVQNRLVILRGLLPGLGPLDSLLNLEQCLVEALPLAGGGQ